MHLYPRLPVKRALVPMKLFLPQQWLTALPSLQETY